MASTHKTYFLAPSWELRPDEVILGSLVANIKSPQRILSAPALPASIDTPIPQPAAEPCSGVAKKSGKWSVGLFAKFLQVITVGVDASYSLSSSREVEYLCKAMSTRRFTPSSTYFAKAAAEPEVQAHLKMGGLGAKVFMVTGIKTAHNITITTTEEQGKETQLKIGVDVPAAQMTIGPKGSHKSTEYAKHTREIAGPIVFAFEVEKIRVNRKGRIKHGGYVTGAMLGLDENGQSDYVIERAGHQLDEDELDDLDAIAVEGIDNQTGERCEIVIP